MESNCRCVSVNLSHYECKLDRSQAIRVPLSNRTSQKKAWQMEHLILLRWPCKSVSWRAELRSSLGKLLRNLKEWNARHLFTKSKNDQLDLCLQNSPLWQANNASFAWYTSFSCCLLPFRVEERLFLWIGRWVLWAGRRRKYCWH